MQPLHGLGQWCCPTVSSNKGRPRKRWSAIKNTQLVSVDTVLSFAIDVISEAVE